MTPNEYIKQRNKYLPKKLKAIFILESPPVSGQFFYTESGKRNEELFVSMMRLIKYAPATKTDGLKIFSARGYFIIDALYQEIDQIKNMQIRNEMIAQDLPRLIIDLKRTIGRRKIPIFPVKRNVCAIVSEPLRVVGFTIIDLDLPYPNRFHRHEFLKKLKPYITSQD